MNGNSQSASRLRIFLGVAGIVAVILLGAKMRSQSQTNTRASLESIDALIKRQVEAWNHGDLDGYLDAALENEAFRFYAGKEVIQGKSAALAWFRERFPSRPDKGELTLSESSIELLGLESACVAGVWQVTITDKPNRSGVFTLILKKQRDDWRIAYFHISFAE